MNRRCPQCGTENREQAKRCIQCNYVFAEKDMPIRMCNAGLHRMDPEWHTCPYCNNADTTAQGNPGGNQNLLTHRPADRTPTIVEGNKLVQPSGAKGRDQMPPASAQPFSESAKRKTKYSSDEISYDTDSDKNSDNTPHGVRRIIGILITYSWRPDGQLFPLREGRNCIGSDLDCDIQLEADAQLSGSHFTILHRGEIFYIDDEKSMNGTYVNGECVNEKRRLPNYARIKTGATVWKFVAFEAPTEEETVKL